MYTAETVAAFQDGELAAHLMDFAASDGLDSTGELSILRAEAKRREAEGRDLDVAYEKWIIKQLS